MLPTVQEKEEDAPYNCNGVLIEMPHPLSKVVMLVKPSGKADCQSGHLGVKGCHRIVT